MQCRLIVSTKNNKYNMHSGCLRSGYSNVSYCEWNRRTQPLCWYIRQGSNALGRDTLTIPRVTLHVFLGPFSLNLHEQGFKRCGYKFWTNLPYLPSHLVFFKSVNLGDTFRYQEHGTRYVKARLVVKRMTHVLLWSKQQPEWPVASTVHLFLFVWH